MRRWEYGFLSEIYHEGEEGPAMFIPCLPAIGVEEIPSIVAYGGCAEALARLGIEGWEVVNFSQRREDAQEGRDFLLKRHLDLGEE